MITRQQSLDRLLLIDIALFKLLEKIKPGEKYHKDWEKIRRLVECRGRLIEGIFYGS